jgi:ribonucleoside-diphosphate reductase alpha chain
MFEQSANNLTETAEINFTDISSIAHIVKNDPDKIVPDYSKDAKITAFGAASFRESYLLPEETSPQDCYLRVAKHFGTDAAHTKRLYKYMSNHWFSPATPILSNGGTNRGLPISCYLTSIEDNLDSIISSWSETAYLGAKGGGIGTNWSKLREIGEEVGKVGKTSGAISFLKVQESITSTINQGSLRRSSAAVYLRIDHPEIVEFISIRRAGGDPRRKVIDLQNAVMLTKTFMQAVEAGTDYDLISPKTGKVHSSISAREIWQLLIQVRAEKGEPYLVFEDHVHAATAETHKKLGLYCESSNLCSEIMLPTGKDHLGNSRTAVCCLSSMNLETWDEWKDNPQIIPDIMEMLDNVIQDFIDTAENYSPYFAKAVYAASRERSVGLGVMGLHSLFQSKNIAFESALAKSLNLKIFKHINKQVMQASKDLADRRGPCPDAIDAGTHERFVYKMAVAPTASIAILCGTTSPSIEPSFSNAYLQKTTVGSVTVTNKYLERVLDSYGANSDEVWTSIKQTGGSVQHLDFLSEHEKFVFKCALEIDQNWIIELAADRAPYIDQSQSVNLFFKPDEKTAVLSKVHFKAWQKGIKSLYYCRSLSLKRAENATMPVMVKAVADTTIMPIAGDNTEAFELPEETCLSCQ